MSLPGFGQLYTELVDPALWLVASAEGNDRGGLIATFVANASVAPDFPRVVVGVAKHHFTWRLIDQSRSFSLHLVDEAHLDWVQRFGLKSGHDIDKFADLAAEAGATGVPLLKDAILWSECVVEAALDTGDRSLFVGQVLRCGRGGPGRPLTMSTMLQTLEAPDRRKLAEQLARDIATDSAAIQAWRTNIPGGAGQAPLWSGESAEGDESRET